MGEQSMLHIVPSQKKLFKVVADILNILLLYQKYVLLKGLFQYEQLKKNILVIGVDLKFTCSTLYNLFLHNT